VRLKERKDWRLIGGRRRGWTCRPRSTARARFGIDVRLPGMLHAALRLCPMLGGAPGRIDAAPRWPCPGVERLVMLPAYGGSTAGSPWSADVLARDAGAAAVEVEWLAAAGGALD
jgi:isoquinoline 1-oxidoreductase beta subunit